MVEARNIGKRYGGRWVLREVSLTVAPGRIVALIGPNGAGKSTLLAIVGRIVGRDAGDVLIDGRPLERYSSDELALRLTYLRQAMDVRTRLSVRDLVSFGRFPHNRDGSRSGIAKSSIRHWRNWSSRAWRKRTSTS